MIFWYRRTQNQTVGETLVEKGVLHSFDGTFAILVIMSKPRRIKVPIQLVPARAKEGTLLKITFDGKELVKIEVDSEITSTRWHK